ncbi:hypothetical protein SSYM_1736 [Serratia symbiotica str. Tucson]|uniref:Uncharacterized protein n=3 Tax=Serratia symbiotica TaxID=138074 RepID=E9CN31_9GAMM|nr:hypothetical protein SSYM_1736 [Serratia symbiotica str. Tucson]
MVRALNKMTKAGMPESIRNYDSMQGRGLNAPLR